MFLESFLFFHSGGYHSSCSTVEEHFNLEFSEKIMNRELEVVKVVERVGHKSEAKRKEFQT